MARPMWIRYAILAAAFCLLWGCGGDQESTQADTVSVDGEPQRGGIVVRRLESECKTLNWVLYSTQYENYVLRYLYDPLVDINERLE